jgi:hypothetical protein
VHEVVIEGMISAMGERRLRRAFWGWFALATTFYLAGVVLGLAACSSRDDIILTLAVFVVIVMPAAFFLPRAVTLPFMALMAVALTNASRVDLWYGTAWRVVLMMLLIAAFACAFGAFRAASALRRCDAERDAREREYERRARW